MDEEVGVALVKALVATIAVEEIVALFWKERCMKLALVVLVMNTFTNPTVNALAYTAPDVVQENDVYYYALVTCLELGVLLVEWRLLALSGAVENSKRAFIMALALNATSFLSGWPLKWIGYWW